MFDGQVSLGDRLFVMKKFTAYGKVVYHLVHTKVDVCTVQMHQQIYFCTPQIRNGLLRFGSMRMTPRWALENF